MIVNNFANINKTNNQLSLQAIKHTEKTTTYGIRNPDRGLEQALKSQVQKSTIQTLK